MDYEKKIERQIDCLIPTDTKLHLANMSIKYAEI